ncbi:SagB/ThcOx family dehydrogenase [Candidatus Nitrosotalea okcheonensis]|uniref:SagB/ThcOx family dehydrogenase n=1 Tax=Candidatus Nitrosotalea okcheonensis TaxID=1903276 RepID=UPI001E30CBF7|nr:SagB/ThcOx family dehydrogenase [Candidatus Nitrosotalea okcheonensis]MDE1877233.1 SagB/ThcOx family dehydrogenase [Nitrososphaerota archaeon]
MQNYEIEAAWHYHNGTKHPNGMLLNRFHVYHPSHRPVPYKIYKNISQVNIPLDKTPVGISALVAISRENNYSHTILDLWVLGRILYFSSGITKKIKFQGLGEMDFRAASCTGALYHIEIYIICNDIPGLGAGVYHFDPKHMKLDTIRLGDFRKFISSATAEEQSTSQATAILVFTDVFSRNSIKYQSREYRHAFWDSGTILANTLAITSAHKIYSKIITGFVDSKICQLLGLNITEEAPIVIVSIGQTVQEAPTCPPLQEINMDVASSDYDIEYPEINAIHESSCLLTEAEVTSWRRQITSEEKYSAKLIPLGKNIAVQEPLEKTIIRRGSTRKFSPEPITLDQLSTILNQTTSKTNTDFTSQGSLSDIYIIANAVDGLESGSYYFVKEKNSLEQLRKGNFRHASGNLGLDQDLPHDASVTIFLLSNLDKILRHFGNRGYRVAQLDAAITGGKMYLASYALGLGATGLTFYDDLVINFFSPHAENKETMFLMAIGKKEKPT